jgi:hypothetical protein
MPPINRIFNGKLNLDTQEFRVPEGDYIEALNITRDSPGEGSDIVVTNIIGNELIDETLPAGVNKVTGRFQDKIRNRVYIFRWNSNDHDTVRYYDGNTNTIVSLIENLVDTDGDVLQFDPSKRINHIDIIYRDDKGDLISWTEGSVTPRKFNVKHIEEGVYSTIKTAFIEAAKAPFLSPPTCAYGSDATRNSNSLRRTLFQFFQRPQYDDYEKGVFFSASKVALPVGYYGSDNDIDNTKNNFITVTVNTGDENVIAIEIGMRFSRGTVWSDVVLVASLNKDQLSIPDNSTYQFLFYNDAIYPTVSDGVQYLDGVQVIPLFFWLPQLAGCQVLANGNVPVYGDITEGYNNYPVNELDITITAENKTNVPPDTDPGQITYQDNGNGSFTFTVNGNISTGSVFTIRIYIPPQSGPPITGDLTFEYTSVIGDNIADVVDGLYATVPIPYQDGSGSSYFSIGVPANTSILYVNVTQGGGGAGTISTEKTWMDDCPYAFGNVYFDDQGRDMPGVVTFSNPVGTDNDYLLTTPSLSLDGTARQTPVISAAINHIPPAGAKKYCWVRVRLQYGNPIEYETCDFQQDANYYYLCLANVEAYKEANSQFIYGTALPEDLSQCRIKIKAGITGGSYNGNVWADQDYQILGTVIKTLTGGISPADDKVFIKIKKPASVPSPAFSVNMLVMVYTPLINPTTEASSVYYEWGESYDIYELGGVLYHRGMDQDQTGSQPATFTWIEGDVYYHQRAMYGSLTSSTLDTLNIIDENFSDFFYSKVNDNGRAQVIEVNAQQIRNPVLYRFGGAYQSGTTVNNTPDFYFENQGEADRGWGDIEKLYIRGRYLYVMQKFKIGIIPILLQIVRDTSGNPLEANSDILLNKINYPYNEDVGIGDVPSSFASDKDAMYGVDDYRNVVWRLSQDGITILSVIYETNSFFASKLGNFRKSLNNGYAAPGQPYTGDPTVVGSFDAFTNKYIVALEEINRYNESGDLIFHQDAYTLSFNEVRNSMEGFESYLSYHPENMVSLNNLLIAFKDGRTWIFTEDAPMCNFFGVQYSAYITCVFNDSGLEKKSWMSITQLTDTKWACPVIYTNVNTYAGQRQETNLIEDEFVKLEDNPSASIKRDINSRGGKINGNFIKGNYIVIRFLKQNASTLVYLNGVSVLYKDSPLTSK